jgi:uncharacterized protein YceK
MRHLVAVLFASFVLGGCGSYRVLSESKVGGTVALEGSHDGARAKAEQYMRTQCPAGYEIVEEGDAASPSEEHSREWRVAYACAGARRTALVGF